MLIRDVDTSAPLEPGDPGDPGATATVDVRLGGGRVLDIGPHLVRSPGEETVDGRGGWLLPGLHDHHIHLLALAAATRSVPCGPPMVRTAARFASVLRQASADLPPGAWLRGVGYHDSVAGHLDRRALDAIVADRPVRIQHRGGALWVLNSAAFARTGLDVDPDAAVRDGADPSQLGRDAAGRPDGRLFRLDGWLRARTGPRSTPDLGAVGTMLAGFGVTGVTDATATTTAADAAVLTAAVNAGDLPQRLLLTGPPELRRPPAPRVSLGPVKIVLDEAFPLPLPDLTDRVRAARAAGRRVAVHCVTTADLVLALTALADAGARPGDRIEHAALVPPDVVDLLRRRGVTVVTQPHFVAERGEEYLREVEPADRPWLYRCGALRVAGVPVAAGTDAPFGGPDPWASARAAVERRTAAGRPLGVDEAVAPAAALGLFLGDPADPGGAPRRVEVGGPADLCLLAVPRREGLRLLSAEAVAATFTSGARVDAGRDTTAGAGGAMTPGRTARRPGRSGR